MQKYNTFIILIYILNIGTMIKNKWRKAKICLTVLLLMIAILWTFVLHLRYFQSDFRVEMLGFNQTISQLSSELYLKTVEASFKADNFQLVQLINQTATDPDSNDALLVISASTQLTGGEYIHLLNKIDSTLSHGSIPFYIIRRKKNILFHTTKQLRSQINDIVQMLQYFGYAHRQKKVSLIAFEQGSLLTLRALSLVQYQVFSILHTLFLINPFNPTLPILLSTPYSFIEDTKEIIVRDSLRVSKLNDTKIIIINTVDNNVGDNKKINWLFELNHGEKVRFANTAVVSSKFMWNVYSYLKTDEYFHFQPFLWILSKCFKENILNKDLSAKDLEYILLYKESVVPKSLSMLTRRKIINKCVDFYIQNYGKIAINIGYEGVSFKGECFRILRKENVFFNENTTFLLVAKHKFEVYGENYEKIVTYDTKTDEIIYLLENVLDYKRFFIVNRNKIQIKLTIQSTMLPRGFIPIGIQIDDFFHDLEFRRYYLHDHTRKQIIQACPGSSLIFPYHFGPRNNWDKRLYLETFHQDDRTCYKASDFLMFWLEEIVENWSLGYNIAIFTLYCSHILQKSTFSRFYFQFLINITLAFCAVGEFLPVQNILLLSVIVLLELSFRFWIWTAQLINAPRQLIAKMLWIPVVFEIAQELQPDTYPSPWKILGILFYALIHRKNIIILFLQVLFVWKYLDQAQMNVSGLTMICAWLLVTTVQQAQSKLPEEPIANIENNLIIIKTGRRIKSMKEIARKYRNEIVNSVSIGLIALCIGEDGVVLHYITDFYVITFVMFALHKLFNDN